VTGRRSGRTEQDGQLETLDDLSEAVHYNRWIHSLVAPYLGRRVLEVGCGIGNLTELLARDRARKVLAVDIHPGYLQRTRARLKNKKNISFRRMDLAAGLSPVRRFRADTIVCVNVFEHIQGDVRFSRECFRSLPPGGRLLLFVPALPFLYGTMDAQYGHYRRYAKGELEGKAVKSGFKVIHCRYLNLLGIFGWWWNGRILKKRVVPKAQILLYDKIVRWVAPVEKWLPKPIGLSLFCAAEKPL
jgi:SAM-dependent methyltransferase